MTVVLCIEDEDLLRRDILLELREAGYETLEAPDGDRGLRLIFDSRPDVVLCDIQMPVMDGWEVLRQVRSTPDQTQDMTFIFMTAFADRSDIIAGKGNGADDYITKPIDFDLMLSTIQAQLDKTRRIINGRDAKLQKLETLLSSEQSQLMATREQIQVNLMKLVSALSRAIEIRDPYTAGHQRGVADIAVAIGQDLGLSDMDLCGIEMGALIHDCGKLGIPAEILTFPGRLSEQQFSLVKQHPEIGGSIVADIQFPWPIEKIIVQHHERFDGQGYPYGLAGDDICLEARIVAIADNYEAMSSHRPYRSALKKWRTLEIMREMRGTYFDPQILDPALKVLERL
ncbi:MAG: response regulator [Rhodobacterales bacterium]|nr:response regulator [Rhodobacterales bacterium]